MDVEEKQTKQKEQWLALLEYQQKAFQNRNELEWKLALGFWAAIGGITYAFMSMEAKVLPDDFDIYLPLATCYTALFIISAGMWMLPLQHSHARDIRRMRRYRNLLDGTEAYGTVVQDPEHPLPWYFYNWVMTVPVLKYTSWLACPVDWVINGIVSIHREFRTKQYIWGAGQLGFTLILLIASHFIVNQHFVAAKAQAKAAKTELAEAAAAKAKTPKPEEVLEKAATSITQAATSINQATTAVGEAATAIKAQKGWLTIQVGK